MPLLALLPRRMPLTTRRSPRRLKSKRRSIRLKMPQASQSYLHQRLLLSPNPLRSNRTGSPKRSPMIAVRRSRLLLSRNPSRSSRFPAASLRVMSSVPRPPARLRPRLRLVPSPKFDQVFQKSVARQNRLSASKKPNRDQSRPRVRRLLRIRQGFRLQQKNIVSSPTPARRSSLAEMVAPIMTKNVVAPSGSEGGHRMMTAPDFVALRKLVDISRKNRRNALRISNRFSWTELAKKCRSRKSSL